MQKRNKKQARKKFHTSRVRSECNPFCNQTRVPQQCEKNEVEEKCLSLNL